MAPAPRRRRAACSSTASLAAIAVLLAGCPGAAAAAAGTSDIGGGAPLPQPLPADGSKRCAGRRVLVPTGRPFTGAPPETMPDDLRWAYTRCGAIPEAPTYYVDDTRGGKGLHVKFRAAAFEAQLEGARRTVAHESPSRMLGKAGWVAEAMKRHAGVLANATVLVVGSQQPTFETLALALGARAVTTVEFQTLTYEHPAVTTVTPAQVAADPGRHRGAYDVVLSINAYQHDGTGRYGGPLSPDADLMSMDELREFYLRPGGRGLLFLTVPVGPDAVVWNLHRRYGPVRLPLLLEGWDVYDRVGWDDIMLTMAAPVTKPYAPVHVLRPAAASAGGAAAQAAAAAAAAGGSAASAAGSPVPAAAAAAAGGAGQHRGTPPPDAPAPPAPATSSPTPQTTESARRPGRLPPAARYNDEL
jgi:hypothetical protein